MNGYVDDGLEMLDKIWLTGEARPHTSHLKADCEYNVRPWSLQSYEGVRLDPVSQY